MDFRERTCQHLNLVEDIHEGSIVCIDCALVISSLFLNQIRQVSNSGQDFSPSENTSLTEIKNLLDRIHISTSYGDKINAHLQKNYVTTSMEAIVFSVYKVLNEMGISISMKEISQATNISKKVLHKAQSINEVVHIDFSEVVEKYVRLLGLPYEILALIKKTILKCPKTGHNPNSILAAVIYQVCKQTNQRVSMKKISQVTKVSCISIQRYNKYCKYQLNKEYL